MIPLDNKEIKSFENQKYVKYVKKSFVMMIKTREKSEIIAIILESLEELLIANAI